MRQWTNKEQWTQQQIWTAVEKAMENEPEGPSKDYWTTAVSRDEIKQKYGLEKFAPEPVTITLVRQCCGRKFTHTLTAREKARYLADYKCRDPMCRRRTTVMPFGKYAGLTVALVYEQQPSYVAWFNETVEGCEKVKEAIRRLDGIEEHLVAFRQKRQQPKRQPAKQLTSTQQQVEWLMGKFSTQTVDDVCVRLFCEEE